MCHKIYISAKSNRSRDIEALSPTECHINFYPHGTFPQNPAISGACGAQYNANRRFLHIFRRKIYHTAKPYITYSEGINITFCEAKNIIVRRCNATSDLAFLHIFRRKIYHPSETDITLCVAKNITHSAGMNIMFSVLYAKFLT